MPAGRGKPFSPGARARARRSAVQACYQWLINQQPIKAVIKEGNPPEEILKMVKEENIDLLIMLAHEEGHIEHFLFGRDNEELLRKMPCPILLVKKEAQEGTSRILS